MPVIVPVNIMNARGTGKPFIPLIAAIKTPVNMLTVVIHTQEIQKRQPIVGGSFNECIIELISVTTLA
jgi:hypothetical protein